MPATSRADQRVPGVPDDPPPRQAPPARQPQRAARRSPDRRRSAAPSDASTRGRQASRYTKHRHRQRRIDRRHLAMRQPLPVVIAQRRQLGRVRRPDDRDSTRPRRPCRPTGSAGRRRTGSAARAGATLAGPQPRAGCRRAVGARPRRQALAGHRRARRCRRRDTAASPAAAPPDPRSPAARRAPATHRQRDRQRSDRRDGALRASGSAGNLLSDPGHPGGLRGAPVGAGGALLSHAAPRPGTGAGAGRVAAGDGAAAAVQRDVRRRAADRRRCAARLPARPAGDPGARRLHRRDPRASSPRLVER